MTDLEVLRQGVVVADLGTPALVRVSGRAAWDALDRLLPCDLFLRDGQARQTLLLEPDTGAVVADVVVAADGDDLWLLVDGLGAEVVVERVRASVRAGEEVNVEVLERRWLQVTGPFAWELMAAWDRPSIVGLAYLHHLDLAGTTCLRGGRTGEFAYDLLVPTEAAEATLAALLAAGAPLDVRRVDRSVVHRAALENWFYVPATPGLEGLDPLELQLQWRLSWEKDFPGADVLRARKASGGGRRLVAFRAAREPEVGAEVTLGSQAIGEIRVVLGGEAPAGYALLDASVAHPGVPGLTCGGAPLELVSPPLVVNRSLFVKPQRHRYATRDQARP